MQYSAQLRIDIWNIIPYLQAMKLAMKLKSANYKKNQNILVFYAQWKITSDLNISHEKMYDFVLFPLFGFTLVIILRNFDFEGHWNTLIFYNKKDMVSDMNMSHGKVSDFISFPFFWFTLVIKLEIL